MSEKASDSAVNFQLSPLAEAHQRLGAKMAPFAGWEMPIQYAGIVAEHNAVRESAGIFDISHMGQLWVRGDGAADWLNGLLTNDINDLDIGEGQYTLMLNENGGVIDDLIVYRADETGFFLVVNASKVDEDFAWLRSHSTEDIFLKDCSPDYAAVAVQGPHSADLWAKVGGELGELPPRNGMAEFIASDATGELVIVCRTGYTGEDGFELFAETESIGRWFEDFIAAGAVPCGLGARDTLRLEKCYPLNGNDLDPSTTPLEAGLGFFVKLNKGEAFIGQSLLERQKAEGLKRRLAAIRQTAKGPPPRAGYSVSEKDGDEVSKLTSGSQSPTLSCGIGLAYLPIELAKIGTELEIEVRGRQFDAEVVKKPFV